MIFKGMFASRNFGRKTKAYHSRHNDSNAIVRKRFSNFAVEHTRGRIAVLCIHRKAFPHLEYMNLDSRLYFNEIAFVVNINEGERVGGEWKCFKLSNIKGYGARPRWRHAIAITRDRNQKNHYQCSAYGDHFQKQFHFRIL